MIPATDKKALGYMAKSEGTPKRRLASSMLDSAWSSLVFTALTFVTGVIVARLLGVAGRGDFGEIQYWAGLVVALGTLSAFEAAVYHVRSGEHDPARHLSALLLMSLGLALAATLVFVILHETGVLKLGHADHAMVNLFILLFVCTSFLNQAFVSVERSRLNFGLLVLERLVTPIVYTVLLVLAFVLGWGDIPNILAALVLSTIPLLLIRFWKFRRHVWRRPEMGTAWSVLKVGLKFHGATTVRTVSAQIDRLFVVSLWSSQMLGLYFVAYSAAGAGFGLVAQAVALILLPSFTGLEQAHRASRIARAMRMTMIMSATIALGVIATAPFLMPLLFGQQFAMAARYAQYLAVALSLMPLLAVIDAANQSTGKGRPGLEASLASLAVFLFGYAMTRYAVPEQLFLFMFLSQLAGIAVGLRHLVQGTVGLRPIEALVPRRADIVDIWREGLIYRNGLMKRFRGTSR